MKISDIINGVIRREGGYVNNPDDRGGPTKYGITEVKARAWGYSGDMRDLPRDLAYRIYEHDYYLGPNFNLINSHSEIIAEELVDSAVNLGDHWPARWLQEWLNVFNRRGTDYPDISVDGRCGPATAGALEGFLAVRGDEGERVLLRALNCSQGERYKDLTLARERNETFTYGWVRERVGL